MIKLEAVHIEEVRGIRNLDIEFRQKSFAISGPNGSGKSGVIDAIEFALTGQIGRLTGRGTKALTLSEHGPHVDKTKFPDAAFVTLKVYLPTLKKTAIITRKVASPKKPTIVPADADVQAAFAEIADHPEITLSRRDILRFIHVEPTKRSEEIQTLLKLEDIGQARAALNTAHNKLQGSQRVADEHRDAQATILQRHLQSPSLKPADVLSVINPKRTLLGLATIEQITAATKLDEGLAEKAKAPDFNKQSLLRDIKVIASTIKSLSEGLGSSEAAAVLSLIQRLEADPSLLDALRRRALVEKGLELVDGPECPLCDHPWDDDKTLKSHLQNKLAKSKEAAKLQADLLKAAAALSRQITQTASVAAQAAKIAEGLSDAQRAALFSGWKKDLDGLNSTLADTDNVLGQKARLTSGWAGTPKGVADAVAALTKAVEAKPDQSASSDAHTFLTTAQLRIDDFREARRKSATLQTATKTAKAAYDTYCRAMEDELNALYDDVQADFSTFYREINGDDEAKFTAKLTPSEGKLEFDVNFYERGLFPPGAYHSEGHQDGMGVCLYLALMKRLFGERFTIALLDDVVMSVDTTHRREFCKLLKAKFPNTQFIITTHDRVWAEQMKSAGLVTGKTSLKFHSWSVDTGPLVESNVEIWIEIDTALATGKVEAAAGALRRHLEYASRELADDLGAFPMFRSDGNYELGDLLPSVLGRMRDVLAKAAEAAQSWGNATVKAAVADLKTKLTQSNAAKSAEEWAVNKAVHYNEWANLGKKDFAPVVKSFKELLECFRCPTCQGTLYASPRARPEALRCECGGVNFNLNLKPK